MSISDEKINQLSWLFFATNILTLILTVAPVLMNSSPGLYKAPYTKWYTVEDLIRVLEPILVAPFHLLIFIRGLEVSQQDQRPVLIVILFALFESLYQQGAGFHSASTMFKNTLDEVFLEYHDTNLTSQYPDLLLLKSYMRDYWQHIVSHYMYAGGGILISWLFVYCFRGLEYDSDKKSKLWYINSILYGVTIGLVAINFTAGPIVAFTLILTYGFAALGTIIIRQSRIKDPQWSAKKFLPDLLNLNLVVLHHYLLAYVIAFFIVVGWIAYAKGFKSREDMGIKV